MSNELSVNDPRVVKVFENIIDYTDTYNGFAVSIYPGGGGILDLTDLIGLTFTGHLYLSLLSRNYTFVGGMVLNGNNIGPSKEYVAEAYTNQSILYRFTDLNELSLIQLMGSMTDAIIGDTLIFSGLVRLAVWDWELK